jgi:hypothetical protein
MIVGIDRALRAVGLARFVLVGDDERKTLEAQTSASSSFVAAAHIT